MGAQIAAHLANAGIRTHLLDRVPDALEHGTPASRNALALQSIAALAKQRPAPLMLPPFAERIVAGNLDNDLVRAVAESDLVVEAVVERLDVKQMLFRKVAEVAGPNCILATNTSGISVTAIAADLPEAARSRLAGLHFFNPPRYMHLLEIVPSRFTEPKVVAELEAFGDRVLGKGVVICRDTPNFIGNRIGIADMLLTFSAAAAGGYTPEEVDWLNGPLMGRPRTGTFRLADMIGLDVLGHVVRNLQGALSGNPNDPNYDELCDLMQIPPVVQRMVEHGLLGDKTRAGFYRKAGKGDAKAIEVLDPETFAYRPPKPVEFPELANIAKIPDIKQRVHAALQTEGRAGEFLRKVYFGLFNYAANRLGSIAPSPKPIDDAMRWGYGWSQGPFQLWDAADVAGSERQFSTMQLATAPAARRLLERHGKEARWYAGRPSAKMVFVPDGDYVAVPIPPGMISLDACKDARGVIHSTKTANLVDLGDGVACLEFASKMNTLDEGVMTMLREAVPELERRGGFRALVVGNQAEHFSAGADLRQLLAWTKARDFAAIDTAVRTFQDTMMALRHGPLPVVVAPHGMTLGGGMELALHGDGIVANAELYMGLVEAGVGLVPAGGGLKETCRRASAWAIQVPDGDPYPWVRRAFEAIGRAQVSTSAHDARALGWLASTDGITFHRERVLADAKRRAIALAEAGYQPPDRNEAIQVVGAPRGASFMLGADLMHWGGYISEHDRLIGQKIAHVLTGGMRSTPGSLIAQDLLDLEREAFVSLCGEAKTIARMEHMLTTGKPLRN